MHLNTTVFFLAVSLLIPAAWTTVHTLCYNEVLSTKHCIYSAADNRHRCDAACTKPFRPVAKFKPKKSIGRRYESPKPVFSLDSGGGICGDYDTNKDHGACLWSGPTSKGDDPALAGWLDGAKTSNCNKRLYVQRAGRPETTQYVTLRDGCDFSTTNASIGCYQIGLTFKTWLTFNPTPKEDQQGALENMEWDFDNRNGFSPSQGPV